MPKLPNRIKLVNLIFATFVITLTFFNIYRFVSSDGNRASQEKVLGASTQNINNQNIEYWKEFIKKYPSYRDGYIQLAINYDALGMKDEARHYAEIAHILDPNNIEVKNLISVLGV